MFKPVENLTITVSGVDVIYMTIASHAVNYRRPDGLVESKTIPCPKKKTFWERLKGLEEPYEQAFCPVCDQRSFADQCLKVQPNQRSVYYWAT